MKNRSCRATIPIDGEVAKSLNWKAHEAAVLRGHYENANEALFKKEGVTEEELYGKNGEKILEYYKTLSDKEKKALENRLFGYRKKNQSYANAYREISEQFTNSEISKMTNIFVRAILSYSELFDRLENQENLVDRVLNYDDSLPEEERKHIKDSFSDVFDSGYKHGNNTILDEYLSSYFLVRGLREGIITVDELMDQVYSIFDRLVEDMYNDSDNITDDLFNAITVYYESTTDKRSEIAKRMAWLAKDEIFTRTGINIGKSRSIIMINNGNDVEEEMQEKPDSRDDGYIKQYDTKNLFDELSSNIRLLLSTTRKVVKMTNNTPVFRYADSLELPEYEDAATLHKRIRVIARDCTNVEEILEAMRNSNNPTMKYLADAISKSDTLRQDFQRDFQRYFQSFKSYSLENRKNTISKLFTNVLTGLYRNYDTYGYFKGLSKILKSKYRSPLLLFESVNNNFDSDEALKVNQENWNSFIEYLDEHIEPGLIFSDPNLEDFGFEDCAKDFLYTALNEYLGLGVSKSTLDILTTADPALFKSLLRNLSAISKEAKKENFSISTFNDFAKNAEKGLSGYVKRILEVVDEATDKGNTTVRYNNSTYNKDGMPNTLGLLVNKVRSFIKRANFENANTDELIEELKSYIETEYLVSSEYRCETSSGRTEILNDWIDQLYNTKAEDFTDENSFIYQFCKSASRITSIKDGYREVLAEKMNVRQNILAALYSYMSITSTESDASLGISSFGDYHMFTMGDSQVLKTIRANKYEFSKLKSLFANVAYQEMQRMILEEKAKEQLTKDNKNVDVKTITSSAREEGQVLGNFVYLKALNNYKQELKDAYELGIDAFRDKVEELLFGDENLLMREFENDFVNDIKENYSSIFNSKKIKDEDHETTVFEYIPNMEYNQCFDSEGNLIEKSSNPLYLYYLNSKLAQIYQFQLLKKNPDAYGTSVALQKRYKAVNTPGVRLNVFAKYNGKSITNADGTPKTHEKVIYFKEFRKTIIDSDPRAFVSMINNFSKKLFDDSFNLDLNADKETLLKEVERIKNLAKTDIKYQKLYNKIKDYLETPSTDGQGFRTFSSYREVCIMARNWSDEKEVAYNKIDKLRKEYKKIIDKITNEESEENKALNEKAAKIIDEINDIAGELFNPIKPHNDTTETIEIKDEHGDVYDRLFIPVEHKYAEAIIFPEFYAKGSTMRELGEYMEDNGIDLACSEECVKVGNWGAVDIQHEEVENKETNEKEIVPIKPENIKPILGNAIVHNISYEGYEIQNNYPQHINVAQLVGTQVRKQLFAALMREGKYDLFVTALRDENGNSSLLKEFTLAGEQYDLSDTEKGNENLMKLYNALVSEGFLNSFLNLVDELSSPEKVSKILSEYKRKDGRSSPMSIIRYSTNRKGGFTVPIGEFSSRYENENYLMSHFKNKVQKQRIKGGSLIQITDLGFDDLETHFDENGNITYHDCVTVWDLTVNINGTEVPLNFSDYCNYDGTLRFATDKEGKIIKDSNNNPITKLEYEFPGILDRIAYRIPTERMYSCLNLKVKRFLPKSFGGVIALPSYLVTAAGFDFDIDKLYTFKREYDIQRKYEQAYSDEQLNTIWGDIYNEYHTESGLTAGDVLRDFKNEHIRLCLSGLENADFFNAFSQLKVLDDLTDIDNETKIFRLLGGKIASTELKYRDDKDWNTQQEWLSHFLPDLWAKYSPEKNKGEATKNKNVKPLTLGDVVKAFIEKYVVLRPDFEGMLPEAKLYKYWEVAGITETGHHAAFTKYINEHNVQKKTNFDKYEDTLSTPTTDKDIVYWSKTDRNNLFIDILQSAISNPNAFDGRFTPGGFVEAKRGANILKAALYGRDQFKTLESIENAEKLEDFDPKYDVTNPLTACIYNARNTVAKDVIGIAANHNTNYIYTRMLKTFKLKNAVTLFGRTADNLIETNQNAAQEADLGLAEVLAGSVDAIKVPVLNFLNINTTTANVAELLTRLNYNAEEIGLFLNQPIIRKLCEYMSDKGMNDLTSGCKAVLRDCGVKGNSNRNRTMTNFTKDELFDSLLDDKFMNDKTQKEKQIKVLQTFELLAEQATALSNFINKLRFTASNILDNTYASLVALVYNNTNPLSKANADINEQFIIEVNDKSESTEIEGTLFDQSYFKGKTIVEGLKDKQRYLNHLLPSPLAFEQCMFDCIRGYLEASKKYFPYDSTLYKNIYNIMSKLCLYGELSGDTIELINDNLPLYLISRQQGEFNPEGQIKYVSGKTFSIKTVFDGGESVDYNVTRTFITSDSDPDGRLITNKDYYTKVFPERLIRFLELLHECRNLSDKAAILEEELSLLRQNNRENEIEAKEIIAEELNEASAKAQDALIEEFADWIGLSKNEDGSYNIGIFYDSIIQNPLLQAIDYEVVQQFAYDPITFSDRLNTYYSLKLDGNGHFNKDTKSVLTEAWLNLYQIVPELAINIFKCNFFNRGFSIAYNNFNNIAPHEMMADLTLYHTENLDYTYFQFINDLPSLLNYQGDNVNDELTEEDRANIFLSPTSFKINEFLKLFYRLNHDNYRLVKTFWDSTINNEGKGTLTDSMGNDCTIKYSNGSLTIEFPKNQTLGDSDFKIQGSRSRKGQSVYYNAIPAIKVKLGNEFKLFVLSDVVRNKMNANAQALVYEEINIENIEGSSYSSDLLSNANGNNVTLQDAITEYNDNLSVSETEGEVQPHIIGRRKGGAGRYTGQFGRPLINTNSNTNTNNNILSSEDQNKKAEDLQKKCNS